jgi:hypothetical protein
MAKRILFRILNLVIGAYLGFGAWNLEIAALKASESQISLMGSIVVAVSERRIRLLS